VRYSSLDPDYLAKLDDVVLIHTAAQYHYALSQMAAMSTESAEIGHIRGLYSAVRVELERRGLEPDGWIGADFERPGL
jgi:hypothetical protein